MWQDHSSLRLVCFWKISASESEALKPEFPAGNRAVAAYEYQEIMKQADISAHLVAKISPDIELSVQSLLQDDGQDLAIVTTRLVHLSAGKGFGDNHDVARNASGMNFLLLSSAAKKTYVSYACGVYDLPVPSRPRILEPARRPPIQ